MSAWGQNLHGLRACAVQSQRRDGYNTNSLQPPSLWQRDCISQESNSHQISSIYIHFDILTINYTITIITQEPVSSVSIRTGRPGFDPRQRQRIFPLPAASRPALGPTQPPVQWAPGVKGGRGVMLTTHPLLVPRFRKRGVHLPPPSAFQSI
jgi:hypothetical protein